MKMMTKETAKLVLVKEVAANVQQDISVAKAKLEHADRTYDRISQIGRANAVSRADVDRALASHFGRPVALRLVVEDDQEQSSPSPAAPEPTTVDHRRRGPAGLTKSIPHLVGSGAPSIEG